MCIDETSTDLHYPRYLVYKTADRGPVWGECSLEKIKLENIKTTTHGHTSFSLTDTTNRETNRFIIPSDSDVDKPFCIDWLTEPNPYTNPIRRLTRMRAVLNELKQPHDKLKESSAQFIKSPLIQTGKPEIWQLWYDHFVQLLSERMKIINRMREEINDTTSHRKMWSNANELFN